MCGLVTLPVFCAIAALQMHISKISLLIVMLYSPDGLKFRHNLRGLFVESKTKIFPQISQMALIKYALNANAKICAIRAPDRHRDCVRIFPITNADFYLKTNKNFPTFLPPTPAQNQRRWH